MRFRVEHEFTATLAEMEAAMLDDPSLFPMLARECEALESVKLLTQTDDGRVFAREVEYVPRGKVPTWAERWITREMVSWTESSRYDRAISTFTYTIRPHIPPAWRDRFTSTGSYKLAATDDGCTRRVIDGEIAIRAPLLGTLAERYLVGEVKKNFDQEARALARFLAARRTNGGTR